MSTPVWTWRDAIRKSSADPSTKLICYTLSLYMSDVGKGCWPKVETLCRDTGLTRRAISTHLAKAVEHGLLAMSRPVGRDGRLGSYVYHPRFPNDAALPRDENPTEGMDVPADDPGAKFAHGPGAKNDKSEEQNLRLMNTSIVNSQKLASSARKRSSKKEPAGPVNEAGTPAPEERPAVLPYDWQLPADWRQEAIEARPEYASVVDAEAARFADFYRERAFVATVEGWRGLFVAWWSKARVPQAPKPAFVAGAGYTVRDTSVPFAKYMADMIAQGKYKPAGASA